MAKLMFKVLSLATALALTIYGMMLLNSDYGNKMFEALGFGLHTKSYVAWCQNRVAKMELVTEPTMSVYESERKWLGRAEETFEINYLAMERWLGEYCQVEVEKDYDPVSDLTSKLTPVLRIEFIDGSKKILFRSDKDRFQLKGRVFESSELEDGLVKLGEFFGRGDWSKTEASPSI